MDCKEFERLIPDFMAKRMDHFTMKSFMGHLDHCAGCREELIIQFLVTEGIQRLEDGNVFDLQKELDLRLEEAKRGIRFRSRILQAVFAMEILAVGLMAGIAVWILL